MRSGQCMELVTGGSDMWIFIVFVCVTVTAIIIFVNYRRTKKTMDTIEEMLNVAVKGEFTEGQFDETRMSALETKFAHYLSASALSAQNVEAEKDKIKALIADISHQTKTPIANLLLYSELLLEEELPQQIEGNVSAIHEQTQKLKFLIESLVKLSRLENGILQLVPRMEKLQPMLERAVWELKQKAEELGRPLTACTVTFGCQMNARDSEKLIGILEKIGYVMTEDEHADFVIYNTCTSVRMPI